MKLLFDKNKSLEPETVQDPELMNQRITSIVQKYQVTKPKREVIIDILRGFAVLCMVITHVIAITYAGGAGTSQAVADIGLFGGIISFTAFLFISGISTYYSALNDDITETEDQKRLKRHKKISRLVKLLFTYYILATASVFVNTSLFSFPPSLPWLSNIASILFLTIIPAFSEFLIPLFLISLLVLLFPKFFKFLIKNPLFGLFFMCVVYALGALISQVDLHSDQLNTLKALLGGQLFSAGSLHTFPLFQYFPVFLLGLYLGYYFYHHSETIKRIKLNILLILVFGSLTIAGSLSYLYLQSSLLYPLPDAGRFPPSITFITLSLTLTLISLLFFLLFLKILPKFIKSILNFYGVNAIEALLFHTLLLFGYEYFTKSAQNPNGIKHVSLTDVIIVFLAALFLTAILISIKNYLKKWTLNEKEPDTIWWFFTERAISSLVLVIICGFVGFSIYNELFVKPASAQTNNIVFKKTLIKEDDAWWNNDYSTNRLISIQDTDSALPIFAGSWVAFKFDHEKAVGTGTANSADGNDLRVLYFDKNKVAYVELPFFLENPNTTEAKISFKVLANINPGEVDQNYFLYYGNPNAPKFTEPKDKYLTPPTDQGLTLGAETFHLVKGIINRQWFLKNTPKDDGQLTFEADLQSDLISDKSIVTYLINGSNKAGKMTLTESRKFKATISVKDMTPGTYTIEANVTDPNNSLKMYHSQNVTFYVSYPLYVSWTFDWEGWDVSQDNLNAIANIEDKYQVPSTQFFNPRIYVKDQNTQNNTIGLITPERATYLTNWVKARAQNNGDEIGMHIHMWQDMVKEAGVTPRTTPVIQGTYGSDVPSYAYTESEQETIYNWGKSKFAENGLGNPISFRTGAWMSSESVLQAVQNTGFLIDSSGRTGGPVNAKISYSTQLPWSLSDTTYPYLPNKNDINKWDATSLSDRLKLWEFPDNGADSYWFSKDELIGRFDDNFPNKNTALTRPQTLVYLTHPHWFVSVDYYKIIALFDYISQFKYSGDHGPVIFDNLKDVYSEWDTSNFINGN